MFTDDLIREIDHPTEREIHRLRLVELLDRVDQAGWNMAEHPDLKDGAAAWVFQSRQEDERIDSETLPSLLG